jgi:hypothetical protein
MTPKKSELKKSMQQIPTRKVKIKRIIELTGFSE